MMSATDVTSSLGTVYMSYIILQPINPLAQGPHSWTKLRTGLMRVVIVRTCGLCLNLKLETDSLWGDDTVALS